MKIDLTQQPRLAERIAFFSAWTESQMAYQELPGLAIGLVYDQDLVWAKGFGLADLERRTATTPDTLYRIASITKLFTSTALLQLRDAGRLQLDDPVQQYLPWFKMPPDEWLPDAPQDPSRPVTIRHLLTHTGGLRREAPFPYWTEGNYPSLAEIKAGLSRQPVAYPPETRWKYSNLGLAIAGEVVTHCAGENYAAYITRHILEPLGMHDTLVKAPQPDHPRLATGYSRRLPGAKREVSPHTDAQGLSPAFNMTSSVHDLAQFVMLQFRTAAEYTPGPQQILSPRTLREMQRVHWLEPDWKMGWGLGFSISRQRNATWVGHGGAVLGYRTLVRFVPEKKVGVIVLGNADDTMPYQFADKLLDWVGPYAYQPAGASAAKPKSWESYLGRFRNVWRDVQSVVLNGQLALMDPTMPDPLPSVAYLQPVSGREHVFRVSAAQGYGQDGEYAVFEFDPAGSPARLKLGDNYLDAIPHW
jgi:CubicO group peptidase (beta-lactamase class C family)